MNTYRLIVLSGVLVAFVAIGALSVKRVKAQPTVTTQFQPFTADGFQASGSSQFLLQGDPMGNDATWQRTLGPALGNPFGMIPSVSTFAGAGCQAEYSQDQVVTANKSTLNVSVWGYRCDPYDPASASAGAHVTNGVYSIQGGTGDFQGITGGTGSIQIDARPDGSTFLRISGSILRSVSDAYKPF